MKVLAQSLMVASLLSLSGFAYAQEPTTETNPVKEELKKDNQEVRQEKEQLKKDIQSGAPQEQIKSDKKALHKSLKERRADRKKLHGKKSDEPKQ